MQSRELVSMLAEPDETFHQLIRNVVVFRQELTRNIKGDGVGTVLRDRI